MSDEPDDNIALLVDEIQHKAKADIEIPDAEVQRLIDVIDNYRRQRAIAQATGRRPTKPKKPKAPKLTQLDLINLIPPKG